MEKLLWMHSGLWRVMSSIIFGVVTLEVIWAPGVDFN